MTWWRSWKYKNLTIFSLSLVVAFVLSQFEGFHSFLLHLGGFEYLGAFIAGALFVSTFSVATGIVILLVLAETIAPWKIGIIAGLGAVLMDFTIFRFIKNNLTNELVDIYNHFDNNHHLARLLHSKYFSWTFPVIGALIIASPLPDELGVSLMGIAKMKTYQFLLISFFLNAIGIFLIISASLIIKP